MKTISREQTERLMKAYIAVLHGDVAERIKAIQAEPVKDYTQEYLEKIRQTIQPDTLKILHTVRDKWWLHATAIGMALGGNHKKAKAGLEWLEKQGLVERVQCYTAEKKPNTEFFPLTDKGHDFLQTPKEKRKPTPRLFKHTFYALKVKTFHRKKGRTATLEYRPPGIDEYFDTQLEGKPARIQQRVDVYAEIGGIKHGYEITLNTRNLEANVYKCFLRMDLDEVHVVCEPNDVEPARKKVTESKQLVKLLEFKGSCLHFERVTDYM